MKKFNFRKRIKRNPFTTIFGGIGKRRIVKSEPKVVMIWRRYVLPQIWKPQPSRVVLGKSRIQWIRRSHQGWRNKTFGTISAIKVRLEFGRRKPSSPFRR